MKLLSAPVLGAAAVLTGPALWAAFVTGQLPTDTALVRYVVAAVLTWLAFSAFTAMVGEAPKPEPDADDSPDGDTSAVPAVGDAAGRA